MGSIFKGRSCETQGGAGPQTPVNAPFSVKVPRQVRGVLHCMSGREAMTDQIKHISLAIKYYRTSGS